LERTSNSPRKLKIAQDYHVKLESLDKEERLKKRDENMPSQGPVRAPQENPRGSEGILTAHKKSPNSTLHHL